MREIKFRAYQKDMDMVIYPKKYYCPEYDLGYLGEMYNPEENEFHIVRDDDENFILMQFTGLLDKNSKEIYEGDIVLFLGLKFLVTIDQYGLNFQSIPGYEENRFGKGRLEYIYQDCEIIGNIHETSELLS